MQDAVPTATPAQNPPVQTAHSVVRTRFAPSPTGFMHVGSVRTALFAWLLARQNNGQFILRLEDTDKAREVAGSPEHIIESLRWLGIEWDEGYDKGGAFGPYKQSERLNHYQEWALKLIAAGRAYADPYTPAQVEEFRLKCIAEKRPFLFRDFRPATPPTWDGSQPLRFVSAVKNWTWNDAVMGQMAAGPEASDDFVLVKSDGYPTYNFAHIVDDAEMNISHVIRSQEFVSSIPRFLDLYEALGITPPVLATLPFVMAIDGKKKLSKRDGAKDILDFSNEGILPETMMNFLASLGWNDGTEQEIFTPAELIAKFSLARVQKSPARFDEQRLIWMNGAHIRAMNIDELYKKVEDLWHPAAANFPYEFKLKVLTLTQERLKKLGELSELTWFFFKDPAVTPGLVELMLKETGLSVDRVVALMNEAIAVAEKADFDVQSLHDTFYALSEKVNSKPAELFKLLRISLVGGTTAPGLFETMNALGHDTTLRRLKAVPDAL